MLPIVTYLVSMLALISTVYSTPAVVNNSLSLHNTSFLAAYDDSGYILEWICDHDTSPAHQNSIRDEIDYLRSLPETPRPRTTQKGCGRNFNTGIETTWEHIAAGAESLLTKCSYNDGRGVNGVARYSTN
ncbi:uncharacterized protein PODANS_2_7763 [Podospora anserina S mat+]|uniref:Podospora anserina S mat+ genomic DNA chromosome 2, supercontig 2 n=1 Tax=Podospora anserina (strain S / ATCC MYA-4624 / DSM 980 / FGSC 10383) TaxID=515849 RepID=B2B6G9_PODAN|nr:uncharacterized protein PODANS_2_7763 [Podospora anserina S mat+]CAP73395.1 unnamed protein product [Podospora anserina S mat+]CDP25797.1 Putative protein of unknown function [Podospora anserina S mat+]